ncbi:MAG TPA: type I restriction enzyme HsdR N-terminal domain-containing protein [Rhabdochlamydiaceae bacterium]
MKQVYDNIRQQWVAATPEEIVRQRWIQKMVQELGFPKELLVIERELKMLPHLQQHPYPLPTRRVDVLSFGKGASEIFPLLLIECKDEALSQQALDQALAYNTFVQAYYVAIVNQDQIRLKYNLACKKCEIEHLPSFKDLMEAVSG